ncbi:hypothetical protein [Amycolatopsis sp. YIM 10]|uniref:hypothetical protein n=1 Tax=Amycolatopsis sp. YIM 10 TaxID=2653857 RepID=UPI0012907464|nr:hypothetical protein [Amycolatopsis sp. YIM 10]QFU91595.1 hypothetical protein YIM_32170 [Amycolatopsis sp. YIM 10]
MTVRLFLARPLPGTVGETRRVCHLFPVPDEETTQLVALCGDEFGPGELEQLDRPAGMPCESCLSRAPRDRPEVGGA